MIGSSKRYFGPSSGKLPPECDGVTVKWGNDTHKLSYIGVIDDKPLEYVRQLNERLTITETREGNPSQIRKGYHDSHSRPTAAIGRVT